MFKALIQRLQPKSWAQSKTTALLPAHKEKRNEAKTVHQAKKTYDAKSLGINKNKISRAALQVVTQLQAQNYEAYVVGGAVRDLLLDTNPNDFDVATDATPEQIKAVFRRAFFVGKRFRIVHVIMGRERVEVSTFRAHAQNEGHNTYPPHSAKVETAAHWVDTRGRIVRDNLWGNLEQDAMRRDFTINAFYYDPTAEQVIDFHKGMGDLKRRVLRVIGDPLQRYREDPVRALRAIRLSAKLACNLDNDTAAALTQVWSLLADVPSSRVNDEVLKMLLGGHAVSSVELLRQQSIPPGIALCLDKVIQPDNVMLQQGLAYIDEKTDKEYALAFVHACLLWPQTLQAWRNRTKHGEPQSQALASALNDAQSEFDIFITRKAQSDVQAIYALQWRFGERNVRNCSAVLRYPLVTLALDFLSLRKAYEPQLAETVDWWLDYCYSDETKRAEMLAALDLPKNPKRRRKRKPSRSHKSSLAVEYPPSQS